MQLQFIVHIVGTVAAVAVAVVVVVVAADIVAAVAANIAAEHCCGDDAIHLLVLALGLSQQYRLAHARPRL